ncbi:MAG: outer membrane protein assembly factor BamA [Cardiobacteriaceae bacterium]|nr:outer membrane protein assembly factor BamA [Cardiobacteriaceae bacterium]
MFKRHYLASVITLLLAPMSFAETFNISDIRLEGLHRVSVGTVFNYLPIRVGQTFNTDKQDTQAIIKALYDTKLFSHVKVSREGSVLVVELEEAPIIGELNIVGNKDINSDNIKRAFESSQFGEGQVFNAAMLNEAIQSLNEQYELRNKYQAVVDYVVRPLPRGRVAIDITVSEGRSARIKSINFVGNRVYPHERLLEQFDTTTPRWNSWFNKSDQFDPSKIREDLARLEDFYLNRGFLDFQITSTQAELSAERDWLYLTINLNEGRTYTVKEVDVIGELILKEEEIRQLIQVEQSALYNRSQVRKSIEAIKVRLADEGYARADVQVIPQADKLTGDLKLTFAINPGLRTYVRKIEFTGNEKTYDTVLRRELRQQEAALYSSSDVARSLERLQRLPQLTEVEEVIHPVEGVPDQVDIEYRVVERNTNSISGGVGYGQGSGALFTLNYKDDNFFGTGYLLGIDFSKSSSRNNYGFSFTDPYFTAEGITATYNFEYDSYNYSKEDLSDWISDTWEVSTEFGYPLSEYQKVYFGGGLRGIKITTGSKTAPEISQYLTDKGKRFKEGFVSLAWARDSLNDPYLPTQGALNRFYSEVVLPGSTERFYKLGYQHRSFFGFGEENHEWLTLGLRADVNYAKGYGKTSDVPFYRHYYSGGISSVRGYEYGSVGPRYSDGTTAGGDFAVNGGLEFIVPWGNAKRDKNVRFGAFVDVGSSYKDLKSFEIDELRYSTGLFLQWISPIGPLNISYGVPLKKKDGDKAERFQFTVGTTF